MFDCLYANYIDSIPINFSNVDKKIADSFILIDLIPFWPFDINVLEYHI